MSASHSLMEVYHCTAQKDEYLTNVMYVSFENHSKQVPIETLCTEVSMLFIYATYNIASGATCAMLVTNGNAQSKHQHPVS